MTAQPISARNLLQETFVAIDPLYKSLLIINSPSLIIRVLQAFGTLGSASVALNFIYWLCVDPFFFGAIAFYSYRNLTENQVTVNEAFNQANRRLPQLMLANIPNLIPLFISQAFNQVDRTWQESNWVNILTNPSNPLFFWLVTGLIILIFLWFYVEFRLIFLWYVIVIDNSSALHSISSSWKITKGHYWLIFRSNLLLKLVLLPLTIVFTRLLRMNIILEFLIQPQICVFWMLLYMRLRDSAVTTQ